MTNAIVCFYNIFSNLESFSERSSFSKIFSISLLNMDFYEAKNMSPFNNPETFFIRRTFTEVLGVS